jgi:hypothetical protein
VEEKFKGRVIFDVVVCKCVAIFHGPFPKEEAILLVPLTKEEALESYGNALHLLNHLLDTMDGI